MRKIAKMTINDIKIVEQQKERMKKKGDKHMATLKELIESNLAALEADDNARVVFWKEGEKWKAYQFTLKRNSYLSKEDREILFDIRGVDQKAVVIAMFKFKNNWVEGNKLIFLDEMVHTIERIYMQEIYNNNINVFLSKLNMTEQYQPCRGNDSYDTSSHQQQKIELQQKPTTLKFNKDEFWKSNLGLRLNNHVVNLFFALKYAQEVPSTSIIAISTVLTALNQCYGVQYNISVNENRYGIVSEDGTDWLYTYEG